MRIRVELAQLLLAVSSTGSGVCELTNQSRPFIWEGAVLKKQELHQMEVRIQCCSIF